MAFSAQIRLSVKAYSNGTTYNRFVHETVFTNSAVYCGLQFASSVLVNSRLSAFRYHSETTKCEFIAFTPLESYAVRDYAFYPSTALP